MRTSIPRINNVRLKNGGAKLHIIENRRPERLCRSLMSTVDDIVMKRSKDMAGFAIVSWAHNGTTSTAMHVEDGRYVGSMEVPEFVRNALMDHIA